MYITNLTFLHIFFSLLILGRAEARLATTKRTPTLASNHFISQYFQSFAEDPILKKHQGNVNGATENGDATENGHQVG